jgi:hypothetical protein
VTRWRLSKETRISEDRAWEQKITVTEVNELERTVYEEIKQSR